MTAVYRKSLETHAQSGVKDDLFKFDNPIITEMPEIIKLRLAIAYTSNACKLQQIVPMLHLVDVFQQKDLDIWTKPPGIPWRDHEYETMGDIRDDPEAIRKVRHFWHRIKDGEDIPPPRCLFGEEKNRTVWEYPATITFGEALFCLPLIQGYSESGPFACGYEKAIGFATFKRYVSFCFKKFDETVPAWLIGKVFLILALNIDFCRFQEGGIPDARKMIRMYNYLINYFMNPSIQTKNGLMYRKRCGLVSGSYFTPLVGPICNYIICQWMALELTGSFALDIIIRGDTSLMATTKDLRLKKCNQLVNRVGINIDMKKSQIMSKPQALLWIQNNWEKNLPIRNTLNG